MLVVHRAQSATALADALAELLASPLEDTFAPELVAVPAKGVERWLAQRLSHRLGAGPTGPTSPADGVCANVAFPTPRRLLDDAVASVAPQAAARLAAWAPESLRWSVLEVLDRSLDEPWCRVPRRHLLGRDGGSSASTGRRLGLATHLAALFDGYARNRPEMLRHWAAGHLRLADGTPVDAHEEWQPRLWRLLLEHLDGASPVELHEQVRAAVRAHPDRLALPARLGVFGASRLPRTDVELLAAIAEHRDVHVWLHHASPALWDAVAAAPPTTRRADDATPVRHPLLRSLSRDVRELQMLLRAHAPAHTTLLHATPSAAPAPAGLLARLRAELTADRLPTTPAPLSPGDRSVQVHACHGRARQVDVLRDVVVGLLADDPTLEPRDVLVMCPDVEAFAPLLAATFATGDDDGATPADGVHPATRLRVRVADRALHRSNPLLAVLDRLLDLGSARLTAGEVLDLAEHPAVARRFGLDDDAVERLRGWVSDAGVRWGLDPAHRDAWHLGDVPDGTWRLGLDRLLLGAAIEGGQEGEARPVAGLVPLDDVDSADLDLAGRFAELLDRLAAAHEDLAGSHLPATWAEVLERATLRLAAPPAGEAWQEGQLRDVLAEALVAHVGVAGGARLRLAELRPVLRDALAGQPTRGGFRTGALTVCTLVPMRSVPHRAVVLLGLDDGAFPRRTVRDGDDLLARDPWVGDHDPRSEDRQLLLDAICAAGEHLVVTYTGHDERTGAPVPPAVPLGELLDAIDRTAVGPAGRRGRDAVTTHHPLQPFDARAFTPGALGTARPFSYDPLAYAGALAAREGRAEPPLLVTEPLPAPARSDVALDDVVALLGHPARGFLKQRLLLTLSERDEDPDDALPLELDPLEQWHVGDRMLRERLAGLDGARSRALERGRGAMHRDVAVDPSLDGARSRTLERGRGALPPGPLGDRVLDAVGARVDALAASAEPVLAEAPDSRDVSVDLGDGTRLTGTVGGVRGTLLVTVGYSSLRPKHRLDAWVRLLALTAAWPEQPWQAVTLGRGTGRDASRCVHSTLGPVAPGVALAVLRQYVALYREGLRTPLPVPCSTAAAYAARRWAGSRPVAARVAARAEWEGVRFDGENADAAHVLVLGGKVPFEAVLREPALPTDLHNGWPGDEEGDRFGVLARRLWDPLLRHETAVTR